jgi:hypothetical protein
MAHAYNPSYSRGCDQKDFRTKPAQANTLRDPLEITQQKKG